MDLTGKVAIVTGATRGMGRAISGRLADAGARVALVARTESALTETQAQSARRGSRRRASRLMSPSTHRSRRWWRPSLRATVESTSS